MSEIDRLYRYKTLLSHRRALPREAILAALEISPKFIEISNFSERN